MDFPLFLMCFFHIFMSILPFFRSKKRNSHSSMHFLILAMIIDIGDINITGILTKIIGAPKGNMLMLLQTTNISYFQKV